MAISVTVTDSLEEVEADEFFALDQTLGATGSRGRLIQHSSDPRWEPRYVLVRDGARLRAAVPIFLGHGAQWSDQIHSPREWGCSAEPDQGKSALIGGRMEIRGSLRCADEADVLRAVAGQCASLAELRGRDIYLGYLDERQQRLAEAIFGPVEWLADYDDFTYPEEVVLGSLARLPRDIRQAIRHDERSIAEYGIKADVVPWRDYRGSGCELIAAHNKRKGMTDHPELVRYRMDQWDECDEVSVFVAHAVMGDQEGATTLLVYRDEVEPYEIGLPEGDGPQRRTLYTCLAFGELRRFARDNSCRTVRAGLGAARPKRIRGARAVTRRCGRPRLMV
jgi:hypothetical protein